MSGSINALASVGVAVKEIENGVETLRPVSEVIGDLAGKWGNMSSEQKQSIGLLIAGRFQLSRFLILMQQHEQAVKATTTALNSQGSGLRENQQFLESLEARINKLSNSWTELTLTMGDAVITDTLIAIISGLTNLAKATEFVVGNVGLLPVVFGVAGSSAILLSKNFRTAVVSGNLFSASLKGLSISAATAKAALRGLVASTGVGLAFVALGFIVEKLISKISDFSDKVNDSIDYNQIQLLTKQYEDLKSSLDDTTKSTEELVAIEQQLSTVVAAISDQMPNAVTHWDEFGNATDVSIEKIENWAKKYSRALEFTKNAEIEGLESRKKEIEQTMKELNVKFLNINKSDLSIVDSIFGKDADSYRKDIGNQIIALGNELTETDAKLNKHYNQIEQLEKIYAGEEELDEYTDSLEEQEDAFSLLSKEANNTISSINTLASAYKTLQNGEELSHDTLLKLISDYPKFAQYLNQNNGIIKDKGALLEVIANFEREEQIRKEQRYLDDNKALWESLNGKRRMYEQFYQSMILPQVQMDSIGSQLFTPEEQVQFDKMSAEREQALARISLLSKEIKLDTWNPSSKSNRTGGGAGNQAKSSFNKHIVDEYSNSIEKLDVLIAQSQHRQSKYNETQQEHSDEINEQNRLLKIKRDSMHKQADDLRAENVLLTQRQSKFSDTSEEWHILDKQIDDNKGTIRGLETAWLGVDKAIDSNIKTLKKFNEEALKTAQDNITDWRDNLESVVEEAIKLIKQHYEMRKQHALEAIKDEKDANQKAHDSYMKSKDDELKKFEDTINAQLQLINRTDDEDSFNKELLKMQQERAGTQKEIDLRSMDDSLESKAKVSELNKKLIEQDISIEEHKEKRTKDLRVQNLQDNLKNKQEQVRQEKDAAADSLEAVQEALDKKAEAEEKYWQNKIEDDIRFQEMRDQALIGNLTQMEEALKEFSDNVSAHMFNVGQNMRLNILNQIKDIQQQLGNIGSSATFSSEKRDAWTQYLRNKKNAENQFASGQGWNDDLRKANDQIRSKYGFEDGSHAQLEDKIVNFHEGGFTGKISNPLMDKLHKLLNLNDGELPAILKDNEFVVKNPINVAKNLGLTGGQHKFPSFNSQSGGGGGDTTINMPVTIGSLTGDKSGANEFFSTIRTEMKKKGL